MISPAKNSEPKRATSEKSFSYIQFAVLAGVYLALYQNTLRKLIADWGNDANFSHGYLIPIISGYIAWQKREDWLGKESESSRWGLLFLLLGGLLHVAGNAGSELFTMRFSMILTLGGLFLYIKGWTVSRGLFFPVLYLLFMIPIPDVLWNRIAFPMQIWASQLSARVIEGIGISVLREGNLLHLPGRTLEVVEACSGLRSLTSLLALSAALAHFAPLGKISKGILFSSAVPVALLVNVFRLTFTAAAGEWVAINVTEGFLHDLVGLIVFGTGLILLGGTYFLLSRLDRRNSVAGESATGS